MKWKTHMWNCMRFLCGDFLDIMNYFAIHFHTESNSKASATFISVHITLFKKNCNPHILDKISLRNVNCIMFQNSVNKTWLDLTQRIQAILCLFEIPTKISTSLHTNYFAKRELDFSSVLLEQCCSAYAVPHSNMSFHMRKHMESEKRVVVYCYSKKSGPHTSFEWRAKMRIPRKLWSSQSMYEYINIPSAPTVVSPIGGIHKVRVKL